MKINSPDDRTSGFPVDETDAAASGCSRSDTDRSEGMNAGFGERLREAREARDMSLEAAGQKLRIPVRVLRQLEADDLSGIDSPLYLRGYLRSYTRLLGIDLPDVSVVRDDFAVTPVTLESAGGMSHGRFLLQRYAVASTYVLVTALIVVPTILIGLNGGLRRDLAKLAPLDIAPATARSSTSEPLAIPAPIDGPKRSSGPLKASMTPSFLFLDQPSSEKPARAELETLTAQPKAEAENSAGHNVLITLGAPSWVEITDAAGARIEYALLPAGEHRYASDNPLDVLLGNSTDATVLADGEPVDLARYRHGDLASFRVGGESGSSAPPDGA